MYNLLRDWTPDKSSVQYTLSTLTLPCLSAQWIWTIKQMHFLICVLPLKLQTGQIYILPDSVHLEAGHIELVEIIKTASRGNLAPSDGPAHCLFVPPPLQSQVLQLCHGWWSTWEWIGPLRWFLNSSGGLRYTWMWRPTSRPVWTAPKSRWIIKLQRASCIHFQFLINPGHTFPWILWQDCLRPGVSLLWLSLLGARGSGWPRGMCPWRWTMPNWHPGSLGHFRWKVINPVSLRLHLAWSLRIHPNFQTGDSETCTSPVHWCLPPGRCQPVWLTGTLPSLVVRAMSGRSGARFLASLFWIWTWFRLFTRLTLNKISFRVLIIYTKWPRLHYKSSGFCCMPYWLTPVLPWEKLIGSAVWCMLVVQSEAGHSWSLHVYVFYFYCIPTVCSFGFWNKKKRGLETYRCTIAFSAQEDSEMPLNLPIAHCNSPLVVFGNFITHLLLLLSIPLLLNLF